MAKKEIVPNPELRQIGLDFYKGPFTFDHMGGYIWAKGDETTHGSQMFADMDEAKYRCARIRGWGALQYLKGVDPEALQDEIGVMFAEAVTEYWDRKKNTFRIVLPNPLDRADDNVVKRVRDVLPAGSSFCVESKVRAGLKVAISATDCTYHYTLKVPKQGIDTVLNAGDTITVFQNLVAVEIAPQVMRLGYEVPITVIMPSAHAKGCLGLDQFKAYVADRYLSGSSLTSTANPVSGKLTWRLVLVAASVYDSIETTLDEGDKITVREGVVHVFHKPFRLPDIHESISITRGVGDVGWTPPQK